jgi:hypothetical protein
VSSAKKQSAWVAGYLNRWFDAECDLFDIETQYQFCDNGSPRLAVFACLSHRFLEILGAGRIPKSPVD